MTVRGGGVPGMSMAFMPDNRMGPPLRSLAADAHHCIMVRGFSPHRIEGCGAISSYTILRAPLDFVIPTRAKCAVVLEAVKDGTFGGALTRPSLTASARAGSPICVGRGEETGFQIEQGN